MKKNVGDMNLLQVIVYLDDLIIFGKTLEEHEERLLKVLDSLEEAGLKISRQVSVLPAKGEISGSHCLSRWCLTRSGED